MKKTIEVNDTLQERVNSAIADVKDLLAQYLKDNTPDELPGMGNDLDYSGSVHEIIGSSVPVYTHEIDTIMYLHGNEVEQAFEDSGIGSKDDKWPCGWKAAAIYSYIEQEVNEWYSSEAQDIFDAWQAEQEQKEEEE
jgi:hypothetical protein